MGDVREFDVLKGDRREPCAYCGAAAHVVPLACPRIKSVLMYNGGEDVEIEFRADWQPEDAA